MSKGQRRPTAGEKVKQAAGGKSSVWSEILGKGTGVGGDMNADWSEVDSALMMWLVTLASRNEAAILFGVSRDGKQYHIKIYAGSGSENYWFAGNEDGVALMVEWATDTIRRLEAVT